MKHGATMSDLGRRVEPPGSATPAQPRRRPKRSAAADAGIIEPMSADDAPAQPPMAESLQRQQQAAFLRGQVQRFIAQHAARAAPAGFDRHVQQLLRFLKAADELNCPFPHRYSLMAVTRRALKEGWCHAFETVDGDAARARLAWLNEAEAALAFLCVA